MGHGRGLKQTGTQKPCRRPSSHLGLTARTSRISPELPAKYIDTAPSYLHVTP